MSLTEGRLSESGHMRGLEANSNRVTEDYDSGEFLPDQISGLIGWFDADDAGTYDLDGSSQPMGWYSKVGTARTGQSDPTARPAFGTMPNGRTYLQMNPGLDSGWFLGSGSYDSPGFLTGDDVTICALIRKNGNNGWGRAISLHDSSAGGDDWNNTGSLAIRSDGGGTNYFPGGDRNGSLPMADEQNIGVWCNFAFVFTGSTCTLYNNGETFGPISQSGAFSVDWISVGGRYGSDERLDCDVTEICIFDRVLTGPELAQMSGYYDAKWLNIDASVPDAPVLITATAGNTAVALDWDPPAFNGGATITDYVIERSANGTTGWTVITESVSTTTAHTVTGLTNDVEVFFRVKAVNAIGASVASNVLSATPDAEAAVPWLYNSFPTLPSEFRYPGGGTNPVAVEDFIQAANTYDYTRWDLIGTSPPVTGDALIMSVEVEWMSVADGEIGFGYFMDNTNGWSSGTRNVVLLRQNGGSAVEHEGGGYNPSGPPAAGVGLHRYDLYVDATTQDLRFYLDDPGGTPAYTVTGYTNFRYGSTNHQVGVFLGGGSSRSRLARWHVGPAADGYPI